MDTKEHNTPAGFTQGTGEKAPACLNRYGWCGRISDLIRTPSDIWLAEMESACIHRFSFFPDSRTIQNWKARYTVLRDTFLKLGTTFHELHIIFEYCLPKYAPQNGVVPSCFVWADAVIVSCDTAVVLEFKDGSSVDIEYARQVQMHRNRLQRYHDQSFGMRKWALLIPLASHSLNRPCTNRVTACSPDRLSDALKEQLGAYPEPHKSITEWVNSSYSVHRCAAVLKSTGGTGGSIV